MTYTSTSQVPRRSQWEANSAPSQSYNCNPTSVAFIADFYRDVTFGIEATRRLVTACCKPTSHVQARDMLIKRGVPAHTGQPSAAELTSLVSSGRRPVVIGMLMARVPAAYRGHGFLGVHGVAVRGNQTVAGVKGKIIMDPNFGYGHTPDPTGGKRWYPDSVVDYARSGAGANRNAVIPNAAKSVSAVATRSFGAGVNIRKGPGTTFGVLGTGPATLPYSRTITGASYTIGGTTSNKWDELRYQNAPSYVATLLTRK